MIRNLSSIVAALALGCVGHTGLSSPTVGRDPGVRNAHALFYDDARRTVILFGGADDRAVRGDTWEWDGARWSHLADDGPSARTFPATASDRDVKVTYLFGGNRVLFGTASDTNTFLSDLWLWDGRVWRPQLADGTGPGPRAEAALAFDARRRRLILFGGRKMVNGANVRLDDTWEWDGRVWARRNAAGPSARSGLAMVFDDSRGVVVLFGGSTGTASPETWEWNGSAWTRGASAPSARFNPAMTYDAAEERVVRFGGWLNPTRYGDTWTYRQGRWDSIRVAGPAPRNHTALAYDPARRSAVLFGGHDGTNVFGDVWELRDGRWIEVWNRGPKARVDNGH